MNSTGTFVGSGVGGSGIYNPVPTPAPLPNPKASSTEKPKPKLKPWQISLIVIGVVAVVATVVVVSVLLNTQSSNPTGGTTGGGTGGGTGGDSGGGSGGGGSGNRTDGQLTGIDIHLASSRKAKPTTLYPGQQVSLNYQSAGVVPQVNWLLKNVKTTATPEVLARNRASTHFVWTVPNNVYLAMVEFGVEDSNHLSNQYISQLGLAIEPPVTLLSGLGKNPNTSITNTTQATIVFDWEDMNVNPIGQATFALELSESPNFSNPVSQTITQTINNSQNTVTFDINVPTVNKAYYWRFYSLDAARLNLDHNLVRTSPHSFQVKQATCATGQSYLLCDMEVLTNNVNTPGLFSDTAVTLSVHYANTLPAGAVSVDWYYTWANNAEVKIASDLGTLSTDTNKRIISQPWTTPTSVVGYDSMTFRAEVKTGAVTKSISSFTPYTFSPFFQVLNNFPYAEELQWRAVRPSAVGPEHIFAAFAWQTVKSPGKGNPLPGFTLGNETLNKAVSGVQLGLSTDNTGVTPPTVWSPLDQCPICVRDAAGVRFQANVNLSALDPASITDDSKVGTELNRFLWLRYTVNANTLVQSLAAIKIKIVSFWPQAQQIYSAQLPRTSAFIGDTSCRQDCNCYSNNGTSPSNQLGAQLNYRSANTAFYLYFFLDEPVSDPSSSSQTSARQNTVIGVYDPSNWESEGGYKYLFLANGFRDAAVQVYGRGEYHLATTFTLVRYSSALIPAGTYTNEPWGIFNQNEDLCASDIYVRLESLSCSTNAVYSDIENCTSYDRGVWLNNAVDQSIYYNIDGESTLIRSTLACP